MEQTDVNIGSLCRLCGSKTQSGDRVEIFASDDLSHQIRSLLGLDLSESDLLPTFVCAECAAKLADFNEFKASSHRTDLMFRDLLGNARDASHVDCPGLSDNVAMDSVLTDDSVTIDDFKFEDEPESDVSNYISEPVISANIEQFKESDPLSFELDSITESTSEVLPNDFSTNTHVQNLENTSESILNDSQLSSAHPESGPNDSNPTVRNQPVSLYNNTNEQIPSNNSETKPCNSYTGVQFQSPHSNAEVPNNNSNSRVKVTRRKSISKFPNKNKKQNKLSKNKRMITRNTYKCQVCNKILKNAPNFKMHMKYHNKEYEFFCQYCNKGFFTNSRLQIHIREAHTKEYRFDCEKCDKKFVTRSTLRLHIEAYHIKNKNYHCKICKRSFKLAKHLKHHAGRVHLGVDVPIAFSCDVCGEVFDDKTNLVKHISESHQETKESEETVYPWSLLQCEPKCASLTPTQDNTSCVEPRPSSSKGRQKSRKNPQLDKKNSRSRRNRPLENSDDSKVKCAIVKIISCPHCYIVFRHKIELNYHIKNAHNILNCKNCSKSFSRDLDLQNHIKAEHSKKVLSVDFKECDKAFVMPGQLQEDISKEPPQKKDFPCKLCPKNFNSLKNLNLHHNRLHRENRKKYFCDRCKDKVFFYKDSLTHHMNVTHLGILYSCEFCDKTFTSLEGITAHRESVHFNSKKHVCKICKKAFAIGKYLRVHLKTHSNKKAFQCTKCFMSFKHSKSLKSHLISKRKCINSSEIHEPP